MRRSTGWVLVAVQFALLLFLVLLPGRTDWPTPTWLEVLAACLVLAGAAVVVWSALRLGATFTPNPIPRERGQLVTGGLYRLVRHPVYSGVFLLVIGVVLRSGSWIVLATGAVTVVFFTAKSRLEERHLSARYPDYDVYAATTPRFVPRFWRITRASAR